MLNEVYKYLVRFEYAHKALDVLVRQQACRSSGLHEQQEHAPVAGGPAREKCAVRLEQLVQTAQNLTGERQLHARPHRKQKS